MLTLAGFGGLGWWLAHTFHDRDLVRQLGLDLRPWHRQVLDGLLYGAVASANILWLLRHRILAEPRHVFGQLVRRFGLGPVDMVFLSLCAGIGEEWFFRGAVQPWLGIWFTAVLFVALHGYLNPSGGGMLLYGILMTVIVAGFGYLTERSGLIAAMTAHALVDVAIFSDLRFGGPLAFGRRPGSGRGPGPGGSGNRGGAEGP